MLRLQDVQKCLSKRSLGAFALAGDRDGFIRARGGLVLDEVFEVVVVDVVWHAISLAMTGTTAHATHNGPIRELTANEGCRQTSSATEGTNERRSCCAIAIDDALCALLHGKRLVCTDVR